MSNVQFQLLLIYKNEYFSGQPCFYEKKSDPSAKYYVLCKKYIVLPEPLNYITYLFNIIQYSKFWSRNVGNNIVLGYIIIIINY